MRFVHGCTGGNPTLPPSMAEQSFTTTSPTPTPGLLGTRYFRLRCR